ncbi:MAG: helix-turn-helix domain-containing protein [Phascolarctobacterium sp.]
MMKYVKDNKSSGYIKVTEHDKEKAQPSKKSNELSASELYGKCLGEYLQEQLWENDMKIKDLAAKSGVTTRTISRVLHASCEPCRDTLLRLYSALGVTSLEVEASIIARMNMAKEDSDS